VLCECSLVASSHAAAAAAAAVFTQVEGMELMIDAFNGGELTALQDAEEVLGRLMGYQVSIVLFNEGPSLAPIRLQL
jgi:hypothetical protein